MLQELKLCKNAKLGAVAQPDKTAKAAIKNTAARRFQKF